MADPEEIEGTDREATTGAGVSGVAWKQGTDRKRRTKQQRRSAATAAKALGGNPRWWVPVMLGLMIVGLVWVVVYYLTAATFPVKAWGNWNLAAGFGFIIVGFFMTTRWR